MVNKKSSKRVIPDIENEEKAIRALNRVGQIQREMTRIEAEFNERIATLKAEAAAEIRPLKEEINGLVEALYAFAKAHRKELARGKTIKLPTGTLAWRRTPPSVRIRNVKEAIKTLRERGFGWLIKREVVEKIDKEAILRDAQLVESVPGISITQREEFVVKPSSTGLEIPKKISRRIG